MTYSLKLPDTLRQQGWKVKIRNLERVEPPHVTIMRKTQAWRYGIEGARVLDRVPSPEDVPAELLAIVNARIQDLRGEWDRRYPENPVLTQEVDDGSED